MSDLYCAYFGLRETPFSIAPDPRFVLLSDRHREALAHLTYGLGEGGGFVQLTGEVGTGKTTICRTLLRQLPENVDAALIFNPRLTVTELLQTICQELRFELPRSRTSTKALVDALYAHLLDSNARGRRTVVIIDEAQNLSSEVLEQVRLLTNLETDDNKLLQIFLIGQPELRTLLARESLRQLDQRITARYHLEPLTRAETERYVHHRLSVAGCERPLFTRSAIRRVHRLSAGIPRIINSLCDRALLGAYTLDRQKVDAGIVGRAYRELRGTGAAGWGLPMRYAALGALTVALSVAVLVANFPDRQFLVWFEQIASIESGDREPGPGPTVGGESQAYDTEAKSGGPESASDATQSARDEATPAEQAVAALGSLFTAEPDVGAGTPTERAADPVTEKLAAAAVRQTVTPAAQHERTSPTGGASKFAVAAESTPAATLGDAVASLDANAAVNAARGLLTLWGITPHAGGGPLCAEAEIRGLRCLAETGSWRELLDYDLPAILTLRGDAGEDKKALLLALSEQSATLAIGDHARTFALDEVDPYWTGEFVLLWRPPVDGVTIIGPGRTGVAARWLWEAMARVDGEPVDALNANRVDDELVQRVKTFQRIRGLRVDGIAGPETLLHLGAAQPDPDRPTLGRRVQEPSRPAVTRSPTLIRGES